MDKILNLFKKQKLSTKRVDDMADGMARAALDERLYRMMALHASQPLPEQRHFAPLADPDQSRSAA